jgi:phosphoribosylformimino-5-aminoimidazole carboxamide ribotide isomerase
VNLSFNCSSSPGVTLLFAGVFVIITDMQILPVLDLLNGIVVHGVGGRRDEYRPVESRLVATADAISVARAFRDQLGLTRLYIADLDAILHRQPNLEVYRSLSEEGFELLVDAGLRSVAAAESILSAGATQLIAGLETWPGPDELASLCQVVGTERIIFSLDLQDGRALGDLHSWNTVDPFEIGCRAVQAGIAEMIVLDLARVGGGMGISTVNLCRDLLARFGDLRVITGGGVRDISDLFRLQGVGIDAVLVASSLHDGRIGKAELDLAQVKD